MRDVAGQLQRLETELITRDLWPFLRDVYDHLARDVEMVEMHRDLLAGAMDIYLSSVANRTNQVMNVLTVLGTIALPAIVISGFFGMNPPAGNRTPAKGIATVNARHRALSAPHVRVADNSAK
jgi:magnesium transporter